MRPDDYAHSDFGAPARRPGDRWAFTYYRPSTLPRRLDLTDEVVLALSEADAALGVLNGYSRFIEDLDGLIGPLLTREAVASSTIDGVDATLAEVLRAQATLRGPRPDDDVAEVERHVAATRQGIALIEEIPITQRLLLTLHATVMAGPRGEEKYPGELRRSPVWVGDPDATPDDATFVPPLPEHLPDLLADWERFVNDPPAMPVLVRVALTHYQLETLHPFIHANGRVGRLAANLLLLSEGRLSQPLLSLSGYLQTHRDEYSTVVQDVRERGVATEYLLFFLRAVAHQSRDAVARVSSLVALREQHRAQALPDPSRIAEMVPLIFTSPFLSVPRVQDELEVTAQEADDLIVRAEGYGWLTPLDSVGRGGASVWLARDVLSALQSPTTGR